MKNISWHKVAFDPFGKSKTWKLRNVDLRTFKRYCFYYIKNCKKFAFVCFASLAECVVLVNVSQSGLVTSPGFGVTTYPNDYDCTWQFEADTGFRVQLQFIERFDLERCIDCLCDSVQVLSSIGVLPVWQCACAKVYTDCLCDRVQVRRAICTSLVTKATRSKAWLWHWAGVQTCS